MRSIWSGAISFGLVNIPVKLYSATGENGLNFDMLAKKDLSPIHYKRVSESGNEVDYKDIVKGYELEKGRYVVLTDKDFEKAAAVKTKTIAIQNFTHEDEIAPIYYEKAYYLEPAKGAEKPYALLREALSQSKKVGIASFVLRNREHIAAIKAMGNVILLNEMKYEGDIRDYNSLTLPPSSTVSDKELNMALKLVEQLTEPFKPEQYKDTYIEELKKVIEAKAEGKEITTTEKAPHITEARDLFKALEASFEAAKSSKPQTSKTTSSNRPAAKRATKTSKAKSKK